MKRFILFSLTAFAVSSCKFLESIISEYGIWMNNLSNNEVVVWGTYVQTNGTKLPNERPVCNQVDRTVDMSFYYSDVIMKQQGKDWRKDLSATDTIRIFVFDKEIFEKTHWSVIRDQYLILQRYDFTKAELATLGWHIAYPPTLEMKDIKMWPPYEEAIKQYEK